MCHPCLLLILSICPSVWDLCQSSWNWNGAFPRMSRLLVLMTNKCSTAYVCIQKIPSATFLKGFSHRRWDITRICHHFLTAGTPTILRMKGAAVLVTFFTACWCSQPPAVQGTAVQPYSLEWSCFPVPWEGQCAGEMSEALRISGGPRGQTPTNPSAMAHPIKMT